MCWNKRHRHTAMNRVKLFCISRVKRIILNVCIVVVWWLSDSFISLFDGAFCFFFAYVCLFVCFEYCSLHQICIGLNVTQRRPESILVCFLCLSLSTLYSLHSSLVTRLPFNYIPLPFYSEFGACIRNMQCMHENQPMHIINTQTTHIHNQHRAKWDGYSSLSKNAMQYYYMDGTLNAVQRWRAKVIYTHN